MDVRLAPRQVGASIETAGEPVADVGRAQTVRLQPALQQAIEPRLRLRCAGSIGPNDWQSLARLASEAAKARETYDPRQSTEPAQLDRHSAEFRDSAAAAICPRNAAFCSLSLGCAGGEGFRRDSYFFPKARLPAKNSVSS